MSDRTFQTLPTALQEAPETGKAETLASPQRRRGRRPSHAEHWTKVTVVLFDRQVVFLDRLIADIRATSGAAISRAHVIRGLVDALADSDLDLTSTRSEADLTSVLTRRLRHGSRDSAR
jgi:hypothetical protein